MSKDIDEDLIEATIRRVQEQKLSDEPKAGAKGNAPEATDEDSIDATIRRVQAQAAARDDSPDEDDVPSSAGLDEASSEAAIESQIRRIQASVHASRAEARKPALVEGQSADADLDPIEATIRRVQAQADEQAAAANDEDEPRAKSDAEADEDAIAATIRRVQAQADEQAAAANDDNGDTAEPPSDAGAEDDDPIAGTIRRVQAPVVAREDEPEPEAAPEASAADEDDQIAATIRRVQAQAASRGDESSQFAPMPLPPLDDDGDVVEEAIEFAEKRGADDDAALRPAARRKENPLEETAWPGRDERLLGEPETWEVAAQRLEQGMQEGRVELRALTARFDALLPALERFLGTPNGPAGTPLTVVQPAGANDNFDDRPSVSRMQFGTPTRPPVLRDPSPRTATAAELVEEPAAATGPRLRTLDSDGNLDQRFPRQYRITVEDKRRGVDLVPLHRAIQGMQNVKDMSLLSYSNGVAIVALETIGGIEPDVLGEAVARSMGRETKVEVHNEQTMVVKIQED